MTPKAFGIYSGIDDTLRPQQRVQTYKFEQGEIARVTFPDMRIASGISHWVPGLGYVFCFGDPEVVDKMRHDPNCPLCAANLDPTLVDQAKNRPLIGKATRRFAVNFWKYLTRSRTNDTALVPVQGTVEVLKFAGSFYAKLSDMAAKGLDLRKTDFRIRCEEAQFQNLALTDLGAAVYLQDKETAERVLKQFQEDRLDDEDLLAVIGREVSLDEVEAALERLRAGKQASTTSSPVSLADGSVTTAAASEVGTFDLSSLFGD